jgi:type I restriction enzyme S subunit
MGDGLMEWSNVSFAEVAKVVTGNTPSKKEPDNYGGDVPWVKPPDLVGWGYITQTEETLSLLGQSKARLLPPETVMVCCIGSIGRVGLAGTKLATNQQINSLIFDSLVEPKFGYYYCRSISHVFQAQSSRAIVSILNKRNFEQIKMPLPPLSEQRRIVEILDRADALRRKRARADAVAERVLPALFIKMFGDPATNPMGWERTMLNSVILETQYGTSVRANDEGNGIPVLRMNNIDTSGWMNLHNLKYVVLDDDEIARYKLQPGDLLFNRTNSKELVGKTGIWQNDMDAVAASYLIRLRVDRQKVLPEFIWAYMNTPFVKQMLYEKARQAIGMANINVTELGSLPLILPDIETQKTFTGVLSNWTEHLKKFILVRNRIDQIFQVLLHRAFSGKLTARWREQHMSELLVEMEQQAQVLRNGNQQEHTL